jgi:valyl-tRNA synthetase
MSNAELSTRYDASLVESKWYDAWEKSGIFEPDKDTTKPVYSITIPPPNITGSLHMGHALCYSVQDLLGRYKRLTGHRVLILPGQDHAGIAAQSVVAKNLKKEGVQPHELGREKFTEKVWEWRHESGDTILQQFRALGCSFDWTRTRFTLDPEYVNAVLKVFIEWYERGLIYRGLRVVNWDSALQTSISDIETERKTVKGKLYHLRYPFADGSGDVVIATTRPETMLADVAVAVHPNDDRYKTLIGKTIRLPLTNREIPLLADIYPDPAFGTGAVKITPGHDANDFEVGERHSLPILLMMDGKGKVTAPDTPYDGLSKEKAREQVIKDLEEQGYLVKIEDHEIALQISQRSGEIIEPLASEQWFVSQKGLVQPAIDAVKQDRITFTPDRYKGIYLDWMENIRDWCISRQLWWGHRIPVYYTESGKAVAAHSWEEAEAKAGEKIIRQDDDVLDTWFSSGLWPFATLGWPNQTDDLKTFYPTDVLVTARDILFLWVARMAMMGLDFVGEIPFKEVFVYATVLTEDGKRMSKSLGTGVDPMTIIETKGADALRYTLQSQTGANQDIRYSDRKTEDAKHFCNKIWNASRFILMNLEGHDPNSKASYNEVDRWLLSRLKKTEQIVRNGYEHYDIQSATQALYQFFWSELCDWYIEISKPRLADPQARQTVQAVLLQALDAFLVMLHPIMPFITEEIYQHLPNQKVRFICEGTWPNLSESLKDEKAEAKIEAWLEATRSMRALRAEAGASPMKILPVAFIEGDLGEGAEVVRTQAWFEVVQTGKPEGMHLSATSGGVDIHLPIDGLVDKEKELARIDREIEKLQDELGKLEGRLNNPQFTERAKPEIIERDKAAAEELKETVGKLKDRRHLFTG